MRSGYRWSARRGDVEVAADIAAHAALMGFSVQLFETLAWAEELLEPAARADVPRLPRLYTAAGFACFAGRAEAARANAHRATELESDPRYDACEPGYAIVHRGVGERLLRRSRPLRRAHRRGGGAVRQRPRLRHRLVRRRSPVVRPDRGGAGARRGVHRGRTIARQPLLDRLCALDRRDGVLQGGRRAARSRHGTRASTSCASTACSSSKASSLATPAACTPPTERSGAALVLFADAIGAFQRAGNVPAADHHPGECAGAVRAARPSRAGRDAPRRAVAANRRASITYPSSTGSATGSAASSA